MDDGGRFSVTAGESLGPYVIIRVLDAGGMGEVYEARDTRLNRNVALKVVRRELASDVGRRHRLEHEARAAAALNHPNIVTLHSLEEHEGILFLTMELIDGITLRDAIPRGGFACDQFLRVAIQLSDAVATAHERGIIHRDLKPSNVMMMRGGSVKILDFGISKQRADGTATAPVTESLTANGMLVGTAAYLAPEVIEGQEADTRSDIFSLGVMLFETATGRRPFEGDTPLAAITSILRDRPLLANQVNSTLPLEIAQLIDGCLARDATQRRQSALDLRRDLELLARRFAIHPAVERAAPDSQPKSLGDRAKRRMRRASPSVIVSAGVAMLVFALVAGRFGSFSGNLAPLSPPTSVAIISLDSQPGTGADEYFSQGVTEALITHMTSIGGLRVLPAATVPKLPATLSRSPSETARALGVDALVQTVVTRTDERVRFAMTLYDSGTNEPRWKESYERDLRDVLALENEVALAIAAQLRVRVEADDRARLAAHARSVHPAAYDRYLRGVTLLQRVNRTDVEGGIAALEEAVRFDPAFADAFGALASGYWLLYNSYRPEQASTLEPRARAAVDKALSLDPESAEALAVQGDLLWDQAHGWRHEEAINAHRKALAIKPTLIRSISRLATVYNHVGLADLAIQELAESDESPAVLFQKGLAFRIQGRDDLALASWLAIPPASRNTNHVGHIAWLLSDLGRPNDAWEALRGVPRGTADVNGMLAAAESLLVAVAGDRQQAEKQIAATLVHAAATAESHHATFLAAAAYARLGNHEEALRWLRFTAANGFPCYPLMARDGNLKLMRSYPPFLQFLEEAKTRWERFGDRLNVQAAN